MDVSGQLVWCRWSDSNRHGLLRGPRILSPVRLPFRHTGVAGRRNFSRSAREEVSEARAATQVTKAMKRSSAEEVDGNCPAVRGVAVFPKVQALPGAQGEPAAGDRDAEVHSGKGCTHVGRHVVFALGGVV